MGVREIVLGRMRRWLSEEQEPAVRAEQRAVSLVPHPVEKKYVEQFATEPEIERLRRKCDEYFKVIERVVIERDEWIARYRVHIRQHQVAMNMLERDVVRARVAAGVLLNLVNEPRVEQGLEPMVLQRPEDVFPHDGGAVGKVEESVARHKQLLAELDVSLDAFSERERIARSYPEQEHHDVTGGDPADHE